MNPELPYDEMVLRINELKTQRDFAARILDAVNSSDGKVDLIAKILSMIKMHTGFEAVGIRLMEGDDFPYYLTDGFSKNFVEAEKYLCARDQHGELIRDSNGDPYLECMCGNVLCGRVNPELPFFTEKGSFWTNSTSDLLASTTEKDRQARTRNRHSSTCQSWTRPPRTGWQACPAVLPPLQSGRALAAGTDPRHSVPA